jgi:tRNA nucleotidyltransferase (CCA-adding enzyme)
MPQMVLDQLADVPGLAALRALARERRGDRLWLVGGAVRDAALRAPVRDLDVVVEGDAIAVARRLGEPLEEHERFGTAEVLVDGGRVNLAAARTETYAAPGALPDVTLGATIEEDLRRRDFTVNAIAVALDDEREVAVPGARDDLAAKRLRILHDRSFADDPTRAYRLARYAARLRLDVEPVTARLARAADPSTVSDERIAGEIRLMLREPDPVRTLLVAAELLGPQAVPSIDAPRAGEALRLLPADARPDLLLIASGGDPGAAADWAERLGEPQTGIARVRRAAEAPAIAQELREAARPSRLAAMARREPPEAIALAATHGAGAEAQSWFDTLRHLRLTITGDDLIAAGVPEGPAVGEALRRALDARIDGEIEPTRDAELRAALGR